MNLNFEYFLNRLSAFGLFIAAVFCFYEGAKMINMKREDPKVPTKIYVAGFFTLFLGVLSVVFGVLHFFIDTQSGSLVSFSKSNIISNSNKGLAAYANSNIKSN